jgi:predicted nucleotidyltransferase
MVAFGSQVRGNTGADYDWHPAVFIENFEPSHDERRLYQLALPFEGSLAPPLGLPADRTKVHPELLKGLERYGIPVPGPQGLTFEEFRYWEHDEPDLHELVDGQPVRLPDARQASRRAMRATLAATIAHGGDMQAGRRWLERPHDELGGVPRHLAMKDWHGLARVLRLLEATWPGCTEYDPGSAPFLVGCRDDNLLREAEHFAELEERRG